MNKHRKKISSRRFAQVYAMEQKEDDSRSSFAAILHTVLFAIMTVLSLGGNSLVCLSFYRNRRLRTITNFYVLSLAVADLIVAIFVFPSVTVASALRRWPFIYEFCQVTGFLTNYWAMVSLSILVLTSINRYFCVVKPQRYSVFFAKKKTIISIIFVWIFMFVFYLTFILAVQATFVWHPNALYSRVTFRDNDTEKGTFMSFGIFSFLSMLLVLFGYCSVFRVVSQHNNAVVPFIQEDNGQGAIRTKEIKTSRVLFVAVFGFCVSWMPGIVGHVLEFGFEISIPPALQWMPMFFACISAWINPIIYGVMNRAMRKEFKSILCCWKRRKVSGLSHRFGTFVRTNHNELTVNEHVLTITTM